MRCVPNNEQTAYRLIVDARPAGGPWSVSVGSLASLRCEASRYFAPFVPLLLALLVAHLFDFGAP